MMGLGLILVMKMKGGVMQEKPGGSMIVLKYFCRICRSTSHLVNHQTLKMQTRESSFLWIGDSCNSSSVLPLMQWSARYMIADPAYSIVSAAAGPLSSAEAQDVRT